MRRTGKTTRLIDLAIQTLFTEGEIYIFSANELSKFGYPDKIRGFDKDIDKVFRFIDYDFKFNKISNAQDNFKDRFIRRLHIEHPRTNIIINKDKNYFKLK